MTSTSAEDLVVGKITAITRENAGDEIALAAAAGTTLLTVRDCADFDEDGGTVLIGGATYAYTAVDDDANTLTLAEPLAAPVAEGDRVDEWDPVSRTIIVEYIATVIEDGEPDGDPLEATVDHQLVMQLQDATRGGTGESVTLRKVDDRYELVGVRGKAAAVETMTYLAGGFTTRDDEDDVGVDITNDGIWLYKPGGDPTIIMEASTGRAAFIGEVGTALPGDVGIFMFKVSDSVLGETRTRPVLQFNVDAGRDQPSIQADTIAKSGLWLYSGANAMERESSILLDNGQIRLRIEDTPDVGVGTQLALANTGMDMAGNTGSRILALTDQLVLQSAYAVGPNDRAAIVWNSGTTFFAGIRNQAGNNNQGLMVSDDDWTRLLTAGTAVDVTNATGGSYRALNASAFNVSSDRAAKTELAAPDFSGLTALRAAPVYAYADAAGDRHHGFMADELPDAILTTAGDGSPLAGLQQVSLYDAIALLALALQELDAEFDQLRERKPRRAKRKLT